MPMDCDDNETSRHNLQLAGEGRSRSSSALRPYDFPKFDFDDSLQGHLRFDSLVETEVFLGIQSQEDNQWIEDFSQGSNGMEFNPTPADSCSISRRNNVWSEATSSESVEMLLKSVGQEEMMPGAPFIPESDVTNDQGTLSRYGESSNKHKESNDAYIVNAETTLPLDEVLKDYSDSRRHSVGQLEDALSLLAKDDSASGNSSNINQNALCGDGGTSVNEGKHSCQDECAVENLETKASLEKATNIVAGGDSLSFSGITENVNSNVRVLSPSKASEHVTSIVSHESCGLDGQENNVFIKAALEETAILEGKTGASVQICTGSNSFGSVPESGRDSQEADPDSVRELKSSEGDDKNTLLTSSIQNMRQEEVLATSNEVNEPCDNCQGVSSIDDITQHLTELGGLNPGHCSSTQQNMDPAVQLSHKQDNTHMEDVSANPLKNKSMSEVRLLSMKDNEVLLETGDSKDINNNGSSSDMGMLSSSVVKKDSINLEGSCDDSIVTGKESGANLHAHDSNLFAHDNDISVQVIQENSAQRQADSKAEGDICKSEEADTEISNDLRNVDSENVGTQKDDQRTQSLEVGEVVKGNIPELQPQDCEELESGGLDDHPEFGNRELGAIESLHLDNDSEDGGMKKVLDKNLGIEMEKASKVEDIVANDSVRIPLSELSAKSQQPVEKTNVLCSNEIPLVEAMNSSYSDHPQSHSSCKQSSIKKSVDADFVSGGHHEKAVTTEEEKGSLQTPEIDKASCGSPTIISSSEPLLTEKESQEEVRGYQVAYDSVKDVKPISEDQKRKDLLGDDSSFTFKVNALPDTTHNEPANNWSPISDLGKGKIVGETAPSPKAKTERTASKKAPRQNPRVSDGESGPGTAKGTSERKGRRGVGKGTAKENVKKGNQAKTFQENATGKVERISNILSSTPISSPHVQYGQMQPHGNIDTNKKVSAAAAVPTSSLPDLNSSALNSSTSQPGPFRQPFSDLQQVQLRAQIFVYGSLIQGTAPDEAYMVSAFGSSDGGRSTWEPIWRVAAERVRSQKSSSAACETPRSQSGARTSDALKQGSHSSKAITTPTPLSRASSNDTPAAVLNPIIPLSSPLWNISTPRDSMTSNSLHKGPMDFQPLHSSYQTPIRNFVGHTSWSPATGFPGAWLASPQAASFSSSVRFHPMTITETVKSTSIKDTSAVLASNVKHMTSSPAVHTVIPSPVLGEVFPLHDSKMVSTAELHSVDTKPRKRKKIPSDSQVSLVSEAHTEPVVISDVTNVLPSPIGESTSACRVSEITNLIKPIADIERVSSVVRTKKPDSDAEKAVACSEESLIKVAEAKGQAEDAADLATAAVTHCEDLWSQLAKRRESGLTSDTEAKLASAAVAIAAAASVAKAAAATAKVACNAALQAKLMADEAFVSSKTSGVQDIGNITPASILKSNNATNQPSSILVAAKEAAKRRVEAASAASKQAENLDAIVKAAELAAAAVSQAGKIVAMGEPLPLNELMEAGPEGYWKLHQSPAVLAEEVRDGNIEQSGAVSLGKVVDMSASVPVEDSVKNGGSRSVSVNEVHLPEVPVDSLDVCMNLSDDIKGSQQTDEDLGTGANQKASDPSKSGRLASEPDVSDKSTNFKNERDEFATLAGDGVKKGSLVEVFKPGNGLKPAWYTANVLNLEDRKAYVCYNDVMSDEGSGQFQEWIPLESEEGKAPIIRAAHPLSLQYQQTRKRRRAALGDYAWCVGDKVDVWIDDCWWEGVVTEKNEKDETTLKVHITAQGETSMVRAWNLRRSRSWINCKWAEWSSSSRGNASEPSDTPQEKRQKLGTPLLASKAKDKESNKAVVAPGKPEESKFLNLSTSDRTFDIGKTTNDDNKRAARRPLRTNQQKEGSRVIFGVPKPTGKKRKFMEVSKHFPANKSDKGREVNDPVKFTKYLIPQGAASRSSKVPSRNDPKEKQPSVESRPRVLSTRKAHRTLPQRGNLMSSSAKDSEKPVNHGTEDSVDHDENTSEKSKNHGSNLYEEASEAPLSSLLSHSLSNASKKTSSSHTRSDRLNRGNIVPSSGKLSKIEEDKAVLDTSEPRRSNRRIQPTHRLLEGLQSSMVIPKMPSFSNDKVRRNLPARGK